MPRSIVLYLVLACGLGLVAATAATARDRDRDGLPDRWERRHGLSTHKRSALKDPDRDGLSNRRERRLRTHPRRRDTDRDRLRDGVEVKRYKTNPRRKDTDRDGLRDRAEIKRYKTNPRRKDTDGDGFPDGLEVRLGTDPRDEDSHPAGEPPATGTPPGASPGAASFPSPSTTGVPAGWVPATTRTSDLVITQPGAVVQDVRLIDADVVVRAPNVTLRRIDVQGGWINNLSGGACGEGLVIEDTTIQPRPGADWQEDTEGVVSYGGYTARRVKIWRRSEGFRVGGGDDCGPVHIEDSFVKIVVPDGCLHADGIQGYGGPPAFVSNVTVDFREVSCGTAPFFIPKNQGNTSADVDRLLVMGGGYPFRLGVPGRVRGLRVVNRSWDYGPIDVNCSALSAWEASIVTITADYQVASTVRQQPCTSNGGG